MATKAHMPIDVYLRSFEYEPDATYYRHEDSKLA